jgi:hypothetical protein
MTEYIAGGSHVQRNAHVSSPCISHTHPQKVILAEKLMQNFLNVIKTRPIGLKGHVSIINVSDINTMIYQG